MTALIRVVLDLSRLTITELLAWANGIYAGMFENPAYPNPPVAMPEFRAAIDNFSVSITTALDGGTKAIADRNKAAEDLRRMLRKLAHYVEANCNDDMATFLSSGFQPLSTIRPKPVQASEHFRSVEPGAVSGEIVVKTVKKLDALIYELRHAAIASGGSPGEWTVHKVPSTRAFTVAGLTPGTSYAFQVRTFSRSGSLSEWSDPVTRICL
jgi:hypothetical protein